MAAETNSGFVKVAIAGTRGNTWIPFFQPGEILTWADDFANLYADSWLMDPVR